MNVKIDGIDAIVEEPDRYLQINDICGADLDRIWKHLEAKYGNYDKWFCYHNSEIPYEALDKLGAVLEDDCIEMRVNTYNSDYSDAHGVKRVTNEEYGEFAAFHDERNFEIYRTSERLKSDLSRWGIFTARSDNRIAGYILLFIGNGDCAEIFSLIASESKQYEALIKAAVKLAYDNKKSEVLYMADDNTDSQRAALSAGFSVKGFYKGYRINGKEV
jgi:RimJ/RimL family protein N-acetyltransferase